MENATGRSDATARQGHLRLVVLGATGATGLEVARQATERGHSVTAFVRAYTFTLQGYCIVKKLRVDLFRSMVLQDVNYFNEKGTGELLSRLSSDTQILQNGITVNVSMLVRFSVTALG